MLEHRLVLVDRGEGQHIRWTATCVCGWTARHARRKREAKRMYRLHVESKSAGRARRKTMMPRTPTASDDLPESLR